MRYRQARTRRSHITTSHGFHILTYVYKYTSRAVNLGTMDVKRICYICQHFQMYEQSTEMIGQKLLFWQITMSEIARVMIWYCSISTSFNHGMVLFKHACEKLLCYYQNHCSKRKGKSRRLEGDYHGQKLTRWFLWKKGVNTSDIERRLCAVCGNKSPACYTVSNYIRSFSSDKCNP